MAVDASAQLRAIALALKAQGDRGSLNECRRAIRAGADVGISAARAAALSRLPKRGGLNTYEAEQKIRTAVLSGARTAGVRIIGKASMDTDTGTWRHPTPHGSWVEQTYGPATGWWSESWRKQEPVITYSILSAMVTAAEKIQGA